VEEEHHVIIFLYKSDRKRFGNCIKEQENDILQKKDPFPKTVADMCRVLAGWKKNGNKHNCFSDSNDRVAFATTDGPACKGKGKNKKVTSYKCKKQGHSVNECDKDVNHDDMTTKMSNKKGFNFMNQGQFSDIEEGCTEGDTTDEDTDSSDDE